MAEQEVLWDKFCEFICDDLKYRLQQIQGTTLNFDCAYVYGLYLLDKELHKFGDRLKNYTTMPQPLEDWDNTDHNSNQQVRGQLEPYNPKAEAHLAVTQMALFNSDQRSAFDQITSACSQASSALFFLNGPAGTGKTFTYNVLCHQLRGKGKIVLCVVSSEIAATLLKGNQTAHSTFKIPLDILANS